jgi:hypothetical protein
MVANPRNQTLAQKVQPHGAPDFVSSQEVGRP